MNLAKSKDFFNPYDQNVKVHIIGCGSVGSTVAEMLARFGLTNFVLWDMDTVEEKNIVNQMFRSVDVGKSKVDALADILIEINPAIEQSVIKKPEGWKDETLSGYVFMCVDKIDIRKEIVKKNMYNMSVKGMFDFRTGLKDAQHFAADWSKKEERENLLKSMNFTQEEADKATPMSACNVALGVCTTVRSICSAGVSNFINFCKGIDLKKIILINAFEFTTDAF